MGNLELYCEALSDGLSRRVAGSTAMVGLVTDLMAISCLLVSSVLYIIRFSLGIRSLDHYLGYTFTSKINAYMYIRQYHIMPTTQSFSLS